MPRGRHRVLRSQSRKIVHDVLMFMQKEAKEGLQYDLRCVQKRTAVATGISERTVRRISSAAKDTGSDAASTFRTPGKKRSGKKRVTGLDNLAKGVIKRIIHNFHITEGVLPSIGQLQKKLKNNISFDGSASSLRRILKDIGFKWKQTSDKRKIIIEPSNVRLKRIEYLKKIAKYRAEERPIFYTDESCVEGIIVMQAASKAGFVPNALLMFNSGVKGGDHYSNMYYENYEMWIRTHLMPNIQPNSVVVIGNAPHHNVLEDVTPNAHSKKAEMLSWLIERDIPCSPNMFKPELYKLITLHKEKFTRYDIDRILHEDNHTILRLPPYHPDLNPMEMAWTTIKQFVAKKKATGNILSLLTKLIEDKVSTMDESEWNALYNKVMSIEEEYRKSDIVIDNFTEQFTIEDSENESEDEIFSDTSENDDSSSDEELSMQKTSNEQQHNT